MFDAILRELIEAVPGARGAVFCDNLGEAVNSVGASGRAAPSELTDFDLRVAGAQLATPLDLARAALATDYGALQECVIGGSHETLLVHLLPEGYYLVLCLEPGAITARGMFWLRQIAKRLAVEI